MDFLNRMTEVVEYIEEHIAEDIDLAQIAKIVCCGVYQFGRIFSYVVGVSLAEYIRNRRLSLAAPELRSGAKVIDTALKYGYNSPEAFARAFREMHGISPKEACAKGVTLKMYPRIAFQIQIKGAVEMEYRIEEKAAIKCVGKAYRIEKGVDLHANSWDKYLDVKDEITGRTPNEAIAYDYSVYVQNWVSVYAAKCTRNRTFASWLQPVLNRNAHTNWTARLFGRSALRKA